MSRIVVLAAALVALALGAAHAQPVAAGRTLDVRVLDGRVLDAATEQPIPGATVRADGVATATDPDGRFRLDLPSARVPVTVSFVGYRTATIDPADDRPVVRLVASTTDLQPVVVTAGRSARARAEVPVAVAALSAADLRATRPANLLPTRSTASRASTWSTSATSSTR